MIHAQSNLVETICRDRCGRRRLVGMIGALGLLSLLGGCPLIRPADDQSADNGSQAQTDT